MIEFETILLGFICLLGLFTPAIGLALLINKITVDAQRRLDAERRKIQEAEEQYMLSLANLKADPTNPALKETALYFGRVYAALTRANRSVTIFDEVALKNDLDAASAGGRNSPRRDESQCPWCAEIIMTQAKICRYCGRDVNLFSTNSDEDVETLAETMFQQAKRQAKVDKAAAKQTLKDLISRYPNTLAAEKSRKAIS